MPTRFCCYSIFCGLYPELEHIRLQYSQHPTIFFSVSKPVPLWPLTMAKNCALLPQLVFVHYNLCKNDCHSNAAYSTVVDFPRLPETWNSAYLTLNCNLLKTWRNMSTFVWFIPLYVYQSKKQHPQFFFSLSTIRPHQFNFLVHGFFHKKYGARGGNKNENKKL